MFIRQKRAITLLEVLIATALTAILLSALTFFYRDLTVLNADVDRLYTVQFQQSYLQKRLASVLPKIVAPKPKQKDFYFFTSPVNGQPSLVFVYDNEACLDRTYGSLVLGRIYLDSGGNLVLGTWPAPSRWDVDPKEMKKEILMEQVETLGFRFYLPPERDRTKLGSQNNLEASAYNHWLEEWPSAWKELPPLMTIQVKRKDHEETLRFAYQLPHSNLAILYEDL